jgi:hypothetical protein
MAARDGTQLTHGEMLYAGTGRTILVGAGVALISVASFLAVLALALGIRRNGWSEPSWEWGAGFAVADRIGAGVLLEAWSILGVFATVLVAVALAGRGTFTMKHFSETATKTDSGMFRGDFDRRLSILMAGRIGLFCELYLAVGTLFVVIHVLYGLVERADGGDAGSALIVVPAMVGGLVLAAHIGVFVTDVSTQMSELEKARSMLKERCDQIARRIEPMEALSLRSSVAMIFWQALSLVFLPALLLAESAVVQRASADVLIAYLVFLVITGGVALVAVLTPWMTDVLEGWSEKAFRIWWWMVVAMVHVLWVLAIAYLSIAIWGWASISLAAATVVYTAQVLIQAQRYVEARRPRAEVNALSKAASPFLAVDQVVLGDRSRQLDRVERQIADLEAGQRKSGSASSQSMRVAR